MSILRFLRDERGVVTADWVVLSAAIVTLSIGTMAVTSGGVENLSDDIRDELISDAAIADYRYFGRSYSDYIRSIAWQTRTADQQIALFEGLVDPNVKSDAELLSEYALWSSLAADPNYSDPTLAAERVQLLEVALDARGLDA